MELSKVAILIGNSDGIGLKVSHLLLAKGYRVIGISRRELTVDSPQYRHIIQDVTAENFRLVLQKSFSTVPQVDLCIYLVGIGDQIKLEDLAFETKVFQTNLMAAVIATEVAITEMLKRGRGHFIGLSSIADIAVSSRAPSYSASKAGISRYWEGLDLALARKGVRVSNIRFGFVATKMAKSRIKPFLMTPQAAAEFIFGVIERPRTRATKPLLMAALAWFLAIPNRLKVLFG